MRPIIGAWPRRLALGLLAAGCALTLAGCSLLSLAYPRLPDLAVRWVDGQLPLTATQTTTLQRDLDGVLAWHRREQLPATAQLLARWAGLVAQPELQAEQLCAEWATVRRLAGEVTRQALPALTRLAQSLDPEQLVALQTAQQQSNDEFRRALSPSKSWLPWMSAAQASTPSAGNAKGSNAPPGHTQRLKRLGERYSQLYGPLSEEQTLRLGQLLMASRYDPERTLAERQRQQADLRRVLASLRVNMQANSTNTEPPPATLSVAPPGAPLAHPAQQALADWVQRLWVSPTPGHSTYSQTLQRETCEQWAQVHQLTSTAQRQHASQRLRGYGTELLALSAP